MANILITHGVPMEGFARLARHNLRQPPRGESFSRDDMLSMLPDFDAVVACGAVDRTMMERATRAKLVVSYGAGYDSIDVAAATALGIPVAHVPDTVTESTAELAMAHLLAVTRRVGELDRRLREADSTRDLFTMGQSMGVLLDGMTLGVVGMGRIGARVAEFGRFLGMRVVYHSRGIKPFSVAGNARRLPLAELLRQSDVVSLHCPLTPDTYHILGREQLALMRPTAFLINTSRGKLTDESALIEALETGRLAGAGLDVFETEPEVSARLRKLPNVTLTPHIGSNIPSVRRRMAEECAQRVLDALAGTRPANLLNPKVWPRRA